MMFTRRHFLTRSAAGALVALIRPWRPWCLAGALPADAADNPYLKGNFAPVREEITLDDLKILGKLPADMRGMFVRNGPNPQFPPRGNYHLFEGDGMLHGVRIRDGKASYRNRYVRTAGWQQEREAGQALFNSFLDPLDLSKLLSGKIPYKNTANTALVWHNGKLLALWEGGEPHEIRLPELETVGPCTFGGQLRHAFTAHPKIDPATGEMLFFGYAPIKPYVQYSILDARGTIVHTTPIDIPRPVMMHDFAITPRYTLFLDLPMTFDFARTARGEGLVKFEPRFGGRIGVLPRREKGDAIRWYEVAPGYVFHTLNAHEEGDDVVLIACRMERFPDSFFLPPSKQKSSGINPEEFSTRMHRWRLNLKTGVVREEGLDDAHCDFPRIHEGWTGRPARYGYATRFVKDISGELLKFDYRQGTTTEHVHGQGRTGGEGVFVPRENAKGEDDGYVVTFVHDEAEGKSELVVIDARDFAAPPIARVLIPARVPHGFHGAWIAEAALERQRAT